MRIAYELPPIGEGGTGRVYAARTLENKSRVVALKKSRHSDYVKHPPLLHEVCALALACGHPNIPEVFGWGRSQYYEYLATELLGCTLATKFQYEPLTRRNFVSVVLQMFAAVEHVHSCGILHCDIKLDNFLLGTGSNSGRIYLIDFGFWTPWCTWNKDSEKFEPIIKKDAAKGFRGTFRYASIDCHLDRALSRKDDMESLAYTIFELYASRLPWSRISDKEPNEIAISKQVWNVPGLLQGACDYPLGHFAHYARSLEFDTDPDYEYWRQEFWNVDNPTTPIAKSDPLYDPDDTTEILPRNMKFITVGPGGDVANCKIPRTINTGRMYKVLRYENTCIPVSDGWSTPYTMLGKDTLDDELSVARRYVELITEPPRTTRPHLDSGCHPEEMRGFNDPLPFKKKCKKKCRRSVVGHPVTEGGGVKPEVEKKLEVEGPGEKTVEAKEARAQVGGNGRIL
ncbi:hypothetical protein V8D89_009898 [Ganoderma adspersum]